MPRGGPRKNSGGARKGAGHPVASERLSAAKLIPPMHKHEFAEYALRTAYEAIDILMAIARGETGYTETDADGQKFEHPTPDAARVSACKELLDRALGKAPQHGDVTALRHTEIVYHTAEEIRQELANRGVPPVLLDYVPPENEDEDEDETDEA